MGNYHQKRVRVNYQYFVVMENWQFPSMVPGFPQLVLLGVDQDGAVHLLNSLFSVLVNVYLV